MIQRASFVAAGVCMPGDLAEHCGIYMPCSGQGTAWIQVRSETKDLAWVLLKICVVIKSQWTASLPPWTEGLDVLLDVWETELRMHLKAVFDADSISKTGSCLVAKLCLTLCDHIDYSPPVSSVHGISQARILKCAAISFSGDLPDPVIQPTSPPRKRVLYHWATREAKTGSTRTPFFTVLVPLSLN